MIIATSLIAMGNPAFGQRFTTHCLVDWTFSLATPDGSSGYGSIPYTGGTFQFTLRAVALGPGDLGLCSDSPNPTKVDGAANWYSVSTAVRGTGLAENSYTMTLTVAPNTSSSFRAVAFEVFNSLPSSFPPITIVFQQLAGQPGAPALTISSGNHQNTTPGNALPEPLSVHIGSGTGGVPITFTISQTPGGSMGASLSTSTLLSTKTVYTLPGGAASVPLVMGSLGGEYQVTATCAICSPLSVVFVETAGQTGCAITTSTLPQAIFGHPYEAEIQTSNAVAPLLFSVTGAMPGGLTVNQATGAITSTAVGKDPDKEFQFSVTVTDSKGCISSPQSFSIKMTHYPLVVVHGIMGSGLYDTSISKDIWLPTLSASEEINRLSIGVNGNSIYPVVTAGLLIGSLYPNLNFYGDLIQYLHGLGYSEGRSLFSFAYDWRKDNTVTAVQLRSFLQSHLSGCPEDQASANQQNGDCSDHPDKIDFVAHSMGGLVVRAYATAFPESVNRIIYLGTPQQGAPSSFATLAGKSSSSLMTLQFSDLVLRVLTPAALTFPSVFELLPRYPFVTLDGSARKLTLAETYGGPSNGYLKSDRWVATAATFHSAIAQPLDIQQYQIIGTGTPTLSSFLVRPTNEGTEYCAFSNDGDGTVPVRSAAYFATANTLTFSVNGVGHQQLPNSPTVQTLVGIILGGLGQANFPPGTILGTPPSVPSAFEWCTGSPIVVTITDQRGNANALQADGTMAVKIPGSEQISFGVNETGFLTPGQRYPFRIKATGPGTFSLVGTYRSNAEVQQAVIKLHDIPVSGKSVGLLELAATGQVSTPLMLDVNGDGVTDFAIDALNPSLPQVINIGAAVIVSELDQNISKSLAQKLGNAAASMERGNSTSATNQIDAAINELQAIAKTGRAGPNSSSILQILQSLRSNVQAQLTINAH